MLHRVLVTAAIALATSAALVACSYNWELPADAGVDGMTTADATANDASAPADAAGTDGSDAGTCTSNAACGPGYLCFFPDFKCGKVMAGKCQSTAQAEATLCSGGATAAAGTVRYCGCNGVTYGSACALLEAGTNLDVNGCGNDPLYTPCGYVSCETSNAYCVNRQSSPTPYSCAAWLGCAAKNCSCNWEPACPQDSGTCRSPITGGTIVTCP